MVANGGGSKLRDQLEPRRVVRPYEWGALWWIGDRSGLPLDQETLYQVVDGTQTMMGFLPTGTWEGKERVSLFWSLRHRDREAIGRAGLERLREAMIRLVPECESFVSQIAAFEQLLEARYLDVVLPRWHRLPGLVFLGDSGHAMSPQLGQGVNLGLLDAAVLAGSVGEHCRLDQALESYTRQRRSHLRFYQFATRWTTPFFQSSVHPLGWARDVAFPLAGRLPFFRREMIRVMMGVKTGFLPGSELSPAGTLGICKSPGSEAR
ncbi:MAG: NAD(P)/FAD-dependent oxidoreductase [Verrucomicrobiota bacterium]